MTIIAKECILEIVKLCQGRVFGAENLHDLILSHCGIHVSEKRIPGLLEELELTVSRFRDPYRGHDTHDHPCDACTNLVKRHFYRNPRAVILTDITYLYYGSHAKLFYMCAFIDAFTAEILGIAASKNMNNSLVLKAYGDMTQNHEYHEFPAGAIVHSDQGSQFGAEKFRKIVKRE